MMQTLTRIALVGTSRATASAANDVDHPAETLVPNLAAYSREQSFLLRAGSRAVFELCGRTGRSDIEALEPCPAEDRSEASSKIIGLLQNAIAAESWDLLLEFLVQIDELQLLLPAELLPVALAISNTEVRERLIPVLGHRGRWLGTHNSQWQWVTTGIGGLSNDDRSVLIRQWDEGNISERCQALRAFRCSEPREGRDLLEVVIDKEKPDHRIRLLAAFESSLSADDEAFLEARLDDRSDKVRSAAANLLARIPTSAFTARIRQRAETMLTFDRAANSLNCQPPESIDKTWHRDGIQRKAPAGRGKRAMWAETILASVAPSHWSQRFKVSPTKLIDAILEDPFAQPVLIGWTRAAMTLSAVDAETQQWLRPLWNHWLTVEQRTRGDSGTRPVVNHLQRLLGSMPDAEDALLPVLQEAVSSANTELLGLLPVLSRPWSDAFGKEYLSIMRTVLREYSDHRAYQWGGTLFTAGRALRRSSFDAALEPWRITEDDSNSWRTHAVAREIEKFGETIETRRQFYNELSGRENKEE